MDTPGGSKLSPTSNTYMIKHASLVFWTKRILVKHSHPRYRDMCKHKLGGLIKATALERLPTPEGPSKITSVRKYLAISRVFLTLKVSKVAGQIQFPFVGVSN